MITSRTAPPFSGSICRRQEAPIEQALEGRLPAEARHELIRHLRQCPRCVGYLAWAQEHDETLRDLLARSRGVARTGAPATGVDLELARRRLVELLASEARGSLSAVLLSLAAWLFHQRLPDDPLLYPRYLPPSRTRLTRRLARAASRAADLPWGSAATREPPVLATGPGFAMHLAATGGGVLARALRLARWSGPSWLAAPHGEEPPADSGAGPGPSARLCQAREVLDEALALTPTCEVARVLRGTTQRAEGYPEPDLLREDWDELARGSNLLARARALSQEAGWVVATGGGRRPAMRRALRLYEQALEIDPEQPDGLFNLWHLDRALGGRSRADRAARRLRRLHERAPAARALARRRVRAADACREAAAITTIEEWSSGQ